MLGFFPDPFPDETLYSIISRYLLLLKPCSYVEAYKDLFGVPETRWSISGIPIGVNNLIKNLPHGHRYNLEKLLINHSLVPYYRSFLPTEKIKEMNDSFINTSIIGNLHRSIDHGNLKYCPICVDHDRKLHGEPYWHRIHQVPGVMICPIHHTFTEESSIPAYDSIKHIALSDYIETNSIPRPRYLEDKNKVHNNLLDIARDSLWILSNHPPISDKFYTKVRMLLKSTAWHSVRGDIFHTSSFIEDFTRHYTNEFLEIMNSAIKNVKKYNWVKVLVSKSLKLGSVHPLRYLLIFRFLGFSAKSFFSSNEHEYTPITRQPFGSGPWPCLNKASDHYKTNTIKDIKIHLCTGTKIPTGIFECPLCGYTYKFRPTTPNQVSIEKYGPIWEKRLMDLYNSSKSWRSIGKELGVCGNTAKEQVIKILSKSENSSQLISKQKEDMFKERRNKYRQVWLKMRSEYPMAKKTDIGKVVPSAARWLSTNDPDWFKQHNQVYVRKPPIDWEMRDIEFKAKAYHAVHDILNHPGYPVKITMYAIFQKIGMIIKRPYRDKVPQTMQFIESAVESDETFRIRRIMWAAKQFIKNGENATRHKLLELASINNKFRYSNSINKAVDETLLWIKSASKNYEH